MDIFVLLQLAVMIIGVQSFKINSKRAELYFSKDQCVSLRGFFALFVIFHHISLETQGGIVFPYFKYIGVLGTTGFFFISGYGLTKQLNKKKKQYLKSFIPHRVGSILIPYLIMTGFYFAYRYKTEDYTIKKMLIAFSKGDLTVSYSWYIIAIIYLYITFFFSAKIYCKKNKAVLFLVINTVGVIVYMVICTKLGYGAWWYNTIPTFLIGTVWGIFETIILKLANKYYYLILTLASSLTLFLLYLILHGVPHASLMYILMSLCFSVVIPLVCLKADFRKSIIARFLGKISLELYLCHGLIVMIFKRLRLNETNELLFTVSILATAIIVATILHCLFTRINRVLFERNAKG